MALLRPLFFRALNVVTSLPVFNIGRRPSRRVGILDLPVELTEMIFLELPELELLRVQRVCTWWHGVMKGSPKIQRKLWFQPSGSPYGQIVNFESPALMVLLQHVDFKLWSWAYGLANPFVRLESFPENTPDKIVRPEASWRRVFSSQPPSKRMLIWDRTEDKHSRVKEWVVDPEGVKLAQLFSITKDQLTKAGFVNEDIAALAEEGFQPCRASIS